MKKLLWILLLAVICQAQTLKEFKNKKQNLFERMAWVETRNGEQLGDIYKNGIWYGMDGVSIGKYQVQPIAYQDVIKYFPALKVNNPDSVLFWNDKFNETIAIHYLFILRKYYKMRTDKDLLIAYNAGIAHVWHYRKTRIKCTPYLIGAQYAKEVMK